MMIKLLVIALFVVGVIDLVLNLGIGAALIAAVIAGLSALTANRLLKT